MRKYLCIIPDCVVNAVGSNVIIYEPIQKDFAIFKRENKNGQNYNNYIIDIENINHDVIDTILSKGFGYIIEANKVSPYNEGAHVTFTSSIQKERVAFGHNTGWHTASCIKDLKVLLNNNTFKAISDELESQQSNYPLFSCQKKTMAKSLLSKIEEILDIANNLESITFCGDIDDEMTTAVNYISLISNVPIMIRTSSYNYDEAVKISSKYKQVYIEFLLESPNDIIKLHSANSTQEEKNHLIAIINSKSSLLKWLNSGIRVSYLPIIKGKQQQYDIIKEMFISFEDVIETTTTIKECLKKRIINTSLFGEIKLGINGDVFLGENIIGNVGSESILSIVTKELQNPDNAWMYTRTKKDGCSECVLSFLCPNISVYERQGLINNACGRKIIHN